MMRAQGWMWMAVLTLGSVGATARAQQEPAPATTSTKTRTGTVKELTASSLQLAGATKDAPPLTYVLENPKQELKASLAGLKAGDSVRVTYAPNNVGAKVVTHVEKLPAAAP
ncbi:hypothetical protein [Corallococcus llansteffanensis]|uniref:DUF5666 domain-containing protein n=1 Tax=Corallococcus llansteffanensis TaxID=2316731 RepID=A0A3A8QC85_9BACT|nr:hypothetical protein [Corallococcus llansteffanensis]RKH65191.1 hypothetical protein D7V93_06400 [Corallococcus llansteffanensis]